MSTVNFVGCVPGDASELFDMPDAKEQFWNHVHQHGCGCPFSDGRAGCPDVAGHAEGHKLGGFRYCSAAMELFDKIPPRSCGIITGG